jgi:hypothetical protein
MYSRMSNHKVYKVYCLFNKLLFYCLLFVVEYAMTYFSPTIKFIKFIVYTLQPCNDILFSEYRTIKFIKLIVCLISYYFIVYKVL